MKKKRKFKVLIKHINDTGDAPKGKNIFYKCTKCKGIIHSQPRDNIGCSCRNVFIDIDYFRLSVMDYNNFEVLEKID